MRSRYAWIYICAAALLTIVALMALEGHSRNDNSSAAGRSSKTAFSSNKPAACVTPATRKAARAATKPDTSLILERIKWMDLPASSDASTMSGAIYEAQKTAMQNALKENSNEQAVKHYEAYIQKYPFAPGTPEMMARAADLYARMKNFEKARQLLDEAAVFLGSDRFVNVIDLNRAHLEVAADNLDGAESILHKVMTKPLPKTLGDPYEVFPQAFVAPSYLAKIRQSRGKVVEADRLLSETADRAISMVKQNPDVEWLPSYATRAYQDRINLIFDTDRSNIDEARKLVDELRSRLGDRLDRSVYSQFEFNFAMWKNVYLKQNDGSTATPSHP